MSRSSHWTWKPARSVVALAALTAIGAALGVACDGDPEGSAAAVDADAGLDSGAGPAARDAADLADASEAGTPGQASCEGVDLSTTLSGVCGACTAERCCAQATACYVGEAKAECQGVIDCIDRCARGLLPDGGSPVFDEDAGDPDPDAGDPDPDAGAAELEACVETCASPLQAGVAALGALTECQTASCAAECGGLNP